MRKRILEYRKYIDELLIQEEENDWEMVLKRHLQQIVFFQHERLIHLIVTVAFALLEMGAAGFFVVTEDIGLALLAAVLFLLLVPYIRHYYLLENEVQKMYGQYDRIQEKLL